MLVVTAVLEAFQISTCSRGHHLRCDHSKGSLPMAAGVILSQISWLEFAVCSEWVVVS